jgi:hypothetical protein
MSYLFDKQGEPDDDLKALEERLASARAPQRDWEKLERRQRAPRWAGPGALVAASLLAGVAYFAYGSYRAHHSFATQTASVSGHLVQGNWLDTTETTDITVASIGHVTVEPQSRVRLVETSEKVQRLELARGALHAKVNAPPRLFVVDTPAAQAVDLGCEYTLRVDASGTTRLEVLKGEVSLEGHGAASRVSAGAVCFTKPGEAPGVPRSAHSGVAFAHALDAWEAHSGGLQPVLATAERDDAVSLWNLLPRVDEQQRPEVLGRLKGVIEEAPKDVADSDVVKLKPPAMESLWQAFP